MPTYRQTEPTAKPSFHIMVDGNSSGPQNHKMYYAAIPLC